MLRIGLFVLLSLNVVAPVAAGEPKTDESVIGGGYEWMAIPCDTWNCAAAELVLAGGSANVLVLPMTAGPHPWVVLRRVRAGSFNIPDDAPIKVDSYDSLPIAATRFDGLSEHAPTLITASDGKKLVIYLTTPASVAPKRRAIRGQ